jgi:hypothetical protein
VSVRVLNLAGVIIATVLVLSGAGYGITRGIFSDDDKPASACRTGTAQWMPVVNRLSLPRELPEGLRLATACYSKGSVALSYGNERRDKRFVVSFLDEGFHGDSEPDGTPVQLGDLVVYSTTEAEPDGSTFYYIRFDKNGWVHSIAAIIDAENKITPDELNAVALNMAEQ